MKICDLHCDTPLELTEKKEKFASNSLHIAADKLESFDKYVQLAAFCVPQNMSDDDGYGYFFKCTDYFVKEAKQNGFSVCTEAEGIKNSSEKYKGVFILTVEDARILANDISRLDVLYQAGVRLITPLWGGTTCIGGAHDTENGLTVFGLQTVKRCAELGILVDISHASIKSAQQISDILISRGLPVIATHSNSYSVCPHTRNLTDSQLEVIKKSGGIVGISLYPPHLTENIRCTADDVCRHILHYVEVIGENSVCLGCDFDGIGYVPEGLSDISKISVLKDTMISHGISEKQIEKIFYKNAYNFLLKYL